MNAEFAKALAAFQAECPIIAKQAEGQVGPRRYKYADLTSIMTQIQPLLTKHGFAFACTTHALASDATGPYLRAMLIHDKETLEATFPLNPNAKPQERGSEITYARRYMLCSMLNIVADEDDDGAKAQEAPRGKPDKKSTDPDWKGDKKKMALVDSVRALTSALETAATLDDLTVLLDSYAQIIEDVKHNLPSWWDSANRRDEALGLRQHIDNAYARVNDIEQGAGVVQ